VPAQDGARDDQAVGAQPSGQAPDEGGEDRPIGPVHRWPRVGAAEHGDLVPQHEGLDVLGAGRAAYRRDQSEHLLEDQIQQPQRHGGDHVRPLEGHHRWSAAFATFWNPTRPLSGLAWPSLRSSSDVPGGVPLHPQRGRCHDHRDDGRHTERRGRADAQQEPAGDTAGDQQHDRDSPPAPADGLSCAE
jgi:hypothetical protein